MKKSHLTRALALVLMLAMAVCAFAGCGRKSDEELIVGKWEGDLDVAFIVDEMNKEMGGNGSQEASILEMLNVVDVSGISVKLRTEFKADGTYTTEMDRSSYETAMKALTDRMVENLPEIMRKYMAEAVGVDADEITDEVLDQLLVGASVSSWEEFGEMIARQMESMDFADLAQEAKTAGQYVLKDGKLYMSDDPDKTPAEEEGVAYKVSRNSLTFELRQGEATGVERKVTLKRVG